jgi:cytidine deaminase
MAGPTVVEEDLIQLLVRKSIEVKSNAFVPYDNFAVGAALLTTSGEIYTGKIIIYRVVFCFLLTLT